jgi:hypothetical protein
MQRSTVSSFLAGNRWSVLWLCFSALVLWLAQSLAAEPSKSKPSAAFDIHYVSALAAADHFLQAWQSGDEENGMALLTAHAKQAVSRDNLDKFFGVGEPAGYEINRGKGLKNGRYEFPVVLVEKLSGARVHRRFSSIVVVNAGNDDWAVDKLP